MKQTLLTLTFSLFLLFNGSLKAQDLSRSDTLDYQIEKVYPNPAREFLFVELFSEHYMVVRFELIDILGNTVKKWEKKELTPGRHKIRFELQKFSSGFYLLKADKQGQIIIKRIRKL
ncbi:T9SS type A sorting domain-containing protein [Sunxiuqinia sp. sy24]|uniref:T9SS type A sorting domain-containing protein n=1 Tax=Sunxiuqinia sp. sy24 TaxID=3461495 RepID=UPI004045FDC0